MNKKRSRLEVIRDILAVLKTHKKVKITHLIYKANLSNNSIKPYISELTKNFMIEEIEEGGKKFYKLSKKGEDFLLEFEKIKIFSDAYGL